MDDKSKSILNILDVGVLLSLVTGILYMFGYSYFEGFYSHFGLPIRVIETKFEDLLLYGAISLWHLLLLLVALLIWRALFLSAKKKWENTRFVQWLLISSGEFFSTYALGMALFIIFVLSFIYIGKFTVLGKEAGVRYAVTGAPLADVVFKEPSVSVAKTMRLGLLTVSRGSYFFFEPVETGTKSPTVLIIPESNVVSVITIGRVGDHHSK